MYYKKLYYILLLTIMVKKSLFDYKKYLKVNDQEKYALYARSLLVKLLLTEKLVGVWKGKKIYLLSFIIASLRHVIVLQSCNDFEHDVKRMTYLIAQLHRKVSGN